MKPDPWSQVNDLDGEGLYAVLGVHQKATSVELRKVLAKILLVAQAKLVQGMQPVTSCQNMRYVTQAYRKLAKTRHPDRGGSAAEFSKLQQAFEVLSDPHQREVYDAWARQTQFRYVPGVAAQSKGGEDVLLDEYEGLGLHCDPFTQLVVTCEVCRRPATKECWTCGMQICEFCTLKRHWKGSFPLHWPLINSDHMRTKLAKRELEKKRIEDDQRLALEDPNFRTEAQLKQIRSFRDAAQQMSQREDRQVTYSMELAQQYMWAQTDQHIFLATHVPTGYEDKPVHIECDEGRLLLQPYKSPPVIDRMLNYPIDCQQPIETFRSKDNTLYVMCMTKQSQDDVQLEIQVPFWIDGSDVHVAIGEHQLHVGVRNTICFSRTYWTSSEQQASSQVVDVEESMWALDEDWDGSTDATRSLMISLARPAPTLEEITWKQGQRQNNTTQQRADSNRLKGYRFFADDEDQFGLENILQAVMFMKSGKAFVPAKPWQLGVTSKTVQAIEDLSKEAQGHLRQMMSGV
ncbi:hypothetical protein ABBQ38_004327 [Trebouxia sp. C0009 RCD-2024]